MVILTLTSAIRQLRPPSCSQSTALTGQCAGPSHAQIGVLILSLALLALGAGGIRPCSLPFGVDQFDKETEKGRRGLASYFNWYYCTSTAGVLIGMTVVVYIQDSYSWTLGFSIPTCLMALSIAFFFLGTRLYVYVLPEGSVFSGVVHAFVAAIRKRHLQLPAAEDAAEQEAKLYRGQLAKGSRITRLPLTLQFRLGKADQYRFPSLACGSALWRKIRLGRVTFEIAGARFEQNHVQIGMKLVGLSHNQDPQTLCLCSLVNLLCISND